MAGSPIRLGEAFAFAGVWSGPWAGLTNRSFPRTVWITTRHAHPSVKRRLREVRDVIQVEDGVGFFRGLGSVMW